MEEAQRADADLSPTDDRSLPRRNRCGIKSGRRRRAGTADCGTICFRLAPILPATLPPALAVFLLLPRNETDKR